MYLVKALAAAALPVVYDGPNVQWQANQLRIIDDNVHSRYVDHADVFTIVAGPDMGAIMQSLANDQGGDAAGAKNGATVTAVEAQPVIHSTTLTFTDTPLTLTDASNGGGVKIYDFPDGDIVILGAVGSIAMKTTSVLASTLNTGVTCNWGIGTTVQANGTLATTEQNILPTTNITASAAINVAGAASGGKTSALAVLNGTGTAIDAYLNVGVATNTDIDADATVTITGAVTISWINLGDF